MLAKYVIRPIFAVLVAGSCLTSCGNDDQETVSPSVELPENYSFQRSGQSTVDFSGQTVRLQMAEELISSMMDFDGSTEGLLLSMFRNSGENGEDVSPFQLEQLNSSEKSIKSKVAASEDYFSGNATAAAEIRTRFEDMISSQVEKIFPATESVAKPGLAGQLADGNAVRYVSGEGLEYNQLVNKSLIGALMLDQILNNYLSPAVLDANGFREQNDSETLEDGSNYTAMEHRWDEAYGYVYGLSQDPVNPNSTIGLDDSFVNKYIGRVENDPDFTGIAQDIFNAFALGRAAIVAKDYVLRDEQAAVLQEKLSDVIAIRAIYYLQQAKLALPDDRGNTALYGTAFHDLSEGWGFIYSLQFTRKPGTNSPYFTSTQVEVMLDELMSDGPNGLWDITPETLDNLSNAIYAEFDFGFEAASN